MLLRLWIIEVGNSEEMERDWADELAHWLQDRCAGLCGSIGQPVALSGLRIHPPLGTEEAKYFLLGLEAGLFRPDDNEIFQGDPPPRIFREGICQLSTVSSLILKRGWLPRQILTGTSLAEHCSQDYGVNILVKPSEDKILAGVAVKRTAPELQKLVMDLGACFRRGPHSMDDCGFPQNHPRYEFCAVYKPVYFWAVAPDADICLKLIQTDGGTELQELATLPARSLIESV